MLQSPQQKQSSFLPRSLALLLLAVAGLIVYSNIFSCPFVLDSKYRIADNFSRYQHLWPPGDWLTYSQRPFAYFTLAVNYALHGRDLWGYHALNLAVHLFSAWTLFAVVCRTLQRDRVPQRYQQNAAGLAWAIALLWLVHPLQTQSVTYTIQRMEAMMGLLYLLTLHGFLRAVDAPRSTRWFVLSAVCCWLGMATKEVMITAPLAVLWYDRVFVARSWREIWSVRRWYYASLCASWLLLAFLITQWSQYGDAAVTVQGVSPLQYALSQPGVILHYLRLSLWPVGQCLDYGWPVARTAQQIVPPLVVLLGLLAATLWCLFRKPMLGLVCGWFFLILGPTSSVLPILDLAFEHRMYLPLAPVCVFVVLGLFELLRWLQRWLACSDNARRTVAMVLLTTTAGTLGYGTYLRNQDYQTVLSIWTDVVKKRPNNARGHYNLGKHLASSGRLEEAIESYRAAIRINAEALETHVNLGAALAQSGRIQESIGPFQAALAIDPNNSFTHYNLGKTYFQLMQLDRAIRHFQIALRIDPSIPHAHTELGVALAQKGRTEEAINSFRASLQIDAKDPETHARLGVALIQTGQAKQAIRHFQAVLAVKPGHAATHYNLGLAYQQLGQIDRAIDHYQTALRINPAFTQARAELDMARKEKKPSTE